MQSKVLNKLFEKKNRFNSILLIALFTFILAWIIQLLVDTFSGETISLLNNSVFQRHYGDSYRDFININIFVNSKTPYNDVFKSSYPPLNFIFAIPFVKLTNQFNENVALTVFYIVHFLVLTGIVILFYKVKKISLPTVLIICAVMILSAPVLHLIERANYIFFAFESIAIFILLYQHQKRWVREISLVFLGIAAALKLYPAIFALLLLKEKRWLDVLKSAGYTLIFIFLPFLYLEGGYFENIKLFLNNLLSFSSFTRLSLDISLGNLVRSTVYIFGEDYLNPVVDNIGLVLRIISLLLIVFASIISKKKWQSMTLIGLAGIIFPHPAMVYSLIFVIPGFISFILSEKNEQDIVSAVCFGLMFIPLQFGYIMPPTFPQYEGIANDVPNYLGLTVSNYIESLACFVLTYVLGIESIIQFAKNIKERKLVEHGC